MITLSARIEYEVTIKACVDIEVDSTCMDDDDIAKYVKKEILDHAADMIDCADIRIAHNTTFERTEEIDFFEMSDVLSNAHIKLADIHDAAAMTIPED